MGDELAVILAGGLGTRLRRVYQLSQILAPIDGKPFLHWLFLFLRQKDRSMCLAS